MPTLELGVFDTPPGKGLHGHVAPTAPSYCRHPLPTDWAAGTPVRPASANVVGRFVARSRRSHSTDRAARHGRQHLFNPRTVRGILRRELEGSVALEVCAPSSAMSGDSAFAHISADAPVVSDMAVTNKVTGASAMWQGSSGLLGLLGSAGYDGSGIGVAVVDSGISQHTALDSRVIARVNFVSWEGPTSGDPLRPRHARRGDHRRQRQRRADGHALFNGGSRARRATGERAGARRRRRRLDQRRDRRHRVGGREPRALQHPRHQPVARPSGAGAGGHRSAVRSCRRCGAGRHRRRRLGRQRRRRRRRAHRCWAASRRPATRRWRSRSARLIQPGTVETPRRYRGDLQLEGPTQFDLAVKPDVAAPGSGSCRSRRRARISPGITRRGTSPATAPTRICG